MNKSLGETKELIKRLKAENPLYGDILDFYEKIFEAQESIKPALNIDAVAIRNGLGAVHLKEGFPLIDKEHFVIDIPSSAKLFEAVCHIGKTVNEKMKESIQAIEEAIAINALKLKELLRRHSDESYLKNIAEEFDISTAILKFLIAASIRPSLKANVEKLQGRTDLRNWLRGYCPLCGSAPLISELKGEGQRYLLCSFCGFQWPAERLRCPFCENSDHQKLHYFYEENRESYRIDLCDSCKQYIKTVDSRKLDYDPDLHAEDIITIHLDILAAEKGYQRPVPSPWGL